MTLMVFGETSMWPTVVRTPGEASARARRATMIRAAATNSSRRSPIVLGPAWAEAKVISSRFRDKPSPRSPTPISPPQHPTTRPCPTSPARYAPPAEAGPAGR